MKNPVSIIQNSWRKNWPEIHCGLTGGLPGFLFANTPKAYAPGVPVFCYHVVNKDSFDKDLAFLKNNGYTTLTADQLLDHIEQCSTAPTRSVVLSFDDGAMNLYDTAYPLLKAYDYKAVAFVCPGLHREHNEPGEDSPTSLCSWAQLKEMHDSGHVDLQPHTMGHCYIPHWPRPLPLAGVDTSLVEARRPDVGSLADDLRRAKDELDRRLKKDTQHLAFPQYDGTRQAIQAGQEHGYRGFWWGVLPGRPMNRPGDPTDHIVRVSGEFVRRLPGEGRVPLSRILKARYLKSHA